MGAQWNQVIIVTQDAAGRETANFIGLENHGTLVGPGALALAAAYQGLTCGNVISVIRQTVHPLAGALTAGAYDTVLDVASIITENADSTTGLINVHAPRDDIWIGGSGNMRVNLSDARVVALLSSMQGFAANAAGSPVTAFRKGRRIQVHQIGS